MSIALFMQGLLSIKPRGKELCSKNSKMWLVSPRIATYIDSFIEGGGWMQTFNVLVGKYVKKVEIHQRCGRRGCAQIGSRYNL